MLEMAYYFVALKKFFVFFFLRLKQEENDVKEIRHLYARKEILQLRYTSV